MSNIQAVRKYVMDLYPNQTWHRKVHNMPDKQVYAIYRKKQEEKDRLKQLASLTGSTDFANIEDLEELFHQIDIWEYLNDRRA